MSGPKTAVATYPAGAVIVAAMALREAYGIARETLQAKQNAADRDLASEAAELHLREAEAQRRIALMQSADVIAGQCVQQRDAVLRLLPDLADRLPALPDPIAKDAPVDAWERYRQTCQDALGEIARHLSAAIGQADQALVSPPLPALPDVVAILNTYLLERQRSPALSAVESAAFAETAARVLERLDRALLPVMPAQLAALARDIVLAPNRERAEALASELRLQVGRANAAALADRQRAEREAASFVLEASLRDLGYQVDDIAETIFVEGGLVHFQKRGWDDYFVRMRIDGARGTTNFNVVRAGQPTEGAQRRADALAEDRWCAEVPRLIETLAARGVRLDITRHLAAGELPVQVVDRASLPQNRQDDTRRFDPPIARERPLS